MTRNTANVKLQQKRSTKATVRQLQPNWYVVDSMSTDHRMYTVRVHRNGDELRLRCDCRHGQMGGEGCVHVAAVLRRLAKIRNKYISLWNTEEEAKSTKHKVVRVGDKIWASLRKRK